MSASPETLLSIYRESLDGQKHSKELVSFWSRHAAIALSFLHEAGWGYGRISKEIGVTKGRVQQIIARGDVLREKMGAPPF